MVQRGRRLGLPDEAPVAVGIGRPVAPDHFQRGQPAEASVPGLVDLSHSAFAQLGEDFVWAQPRARSQRHVCSRGAL